MSARRARSEAGFALPGVLIITFVCGLLAIAALNAVTADLPVARADQDRKSALEAAQAGVAWYASRLQADPAYWSKCATVPAPDSSGQPAPVRAAPLAPGATDNRTWRRVPAGTGQYTVELLPVAGFTECSTSDPARSMLANGTLRVRVTGRIGTTGRRRSLLASFRRSSFVNYVYYTKYEVQDPSTDASASSTPAADSCGRYLREGSYSTCNYIQFANNDRVNGPLHTEDALLTCGSPQFGRTGRTSPDRIEVLDPNGHYNLCGGSGPVFNGTYIHPSQSVDLPPDNRSMAALAGLTLTGRSRIVLKTTGMDITTGGVTTANVAYPANGLIYVRSGATACPEYTPRVTYYASGTYRGGVDEGCGTVDVEGTYPSDLTIAAADDIVVRGSIVRASSSTTAMLGLVSNDFVRVFHPVTGADADCSANNANRGQNAPGYLQDPTIQAGILAVGHSFIVDNYNCGTPAGTLNVVGAIAQKWRGPVATTGSTGYVKNYGYNDDFLFREPPSFLDPVEAAWTLVRQNEQFPAT